LNTITGETRMKIITDSAPARPGWELADAE